MPTGQNICQNWTQNVPVKSAKRGKYRKDYVKERPDGFAYHRWVPTALQPLLGRKSWTAWLGANIGRAEAERMARQHAVGHDALIAGLERLSSAERARIVGAGGLNAWERDCVADQSSIPYLALFEEFPTIDPEQPEEWQMRDALEVVRAREQLAELRVAAERNTKTVRKIRGDTRNSLGGLVDLWVKVSAPRDPSTAKTTARFMREFVDVVGDVAPRAVTANHARAFRDALEKKGWSYENIGKALSRLLRVFNVALSEGQCDANPFYKIKPHGRPSRKPGERARHPWPAAQLRRMVPRLSEMGPQEALTTKILIYSGARPNEICQLRCDDVVKVDGVDALKITTEGDDRLSLKNANSLRIVPIHPIVRAEVLAHVERRRKAGQERLFDYPYAESQRRFSHRYCHRFNRWKREAFGVADKKLTAYSLRHAFQDACRNASLPPYIAYQLTGRELDDGSAAVYGVGASIKVLAKWLKKVDPLNC